MYEYGLISEGGYFGDISALLDEPNEFSYFFNPNNIKATLLLEIEAPQFLEICNNHPVAKEILTKRAIVRKEMFQNYKAITLLKYMRAIIKGPHIATIKTQDRDTKLKHSVNFSKSKEEQQNESKVSLMKSFVVHFELTRQLMRSQGYEKDKDVFG